MKSNELMLTLNILSSCLHLLVADAAHGFVHSFEVGNMHGMQAISRVQKICTMSYS